MTPRNNQIIINQNTFSTKSYVCVSVRVYTHRENVEHERF